MKPAKEIILSEKQLALVGQLEVVMSLTDDLMLQTLAHLTNGVRPPTRDRPDLVKRWREAIGGSITDPSVLCLVERSATEVEDLSPIRNDFAHGAFSQPGSMIDGVMVYGEVARFV